MIESLKRMVIHAEVSGKRISSFIDAIDCDIPLLLSKDAITLSRLNYIFLKSTLNGELQGKLLLFIYQSEQG